MDASKVRIALISAGITAVVVWGAFKLAVVSAERVGALGRTGLDEESRDTVERLRAQIDEQEDLIRRLRRGQKGRRPGRAARPEDAPEGEAAGRTPEEPTPETAPTPEEPAEKPAFGNSPAGAAVRWLRAFDPRAFGSVTLETLHEVRDLNLRGGDLEPKDLEHLRAFPGLTRIDLRRNGLDDEWLAHLPVLPQLEIIRVRGRGITDVGLGHLYSFPALVELDLTETRVSHGALQRLPNRAALTSLRLNRLNIADDDLLLLDGMTAIEHLELDGTLLTDDALQRIGEMFPNLGRLEIRGTEVSREAIREFRTAYPDVEVVHR